jgi:hypothetical protein
MRSIYRTEKNKKHFSEIGGKNKIKKKTLSSHQGRGKWRDFFLRGV